METRDERCQYNDLYPGQHIKQREGDERILGSLDQFCAAFYHVHEWGGRKHSCLDEQRCIIARRARSEKNWKLQPKTVVAVVKFENQGEILYEARYTNCYPQKKHAEDFFEKDITDPQGVFNELIQANPKGTITLYLTYQPCNMSIHTEGTPREQSCCDILRGIARDILQHGDREIKLCVKATHTYTPINEELEKMAVSGIRGLMEEGVDFSGMTQGDWDYLFTMTKDNEQRKELDRDVNTYFQNIERNHSSEADVRKGIDSLTLSSRTDK